MSRSSHSEMNDTDYQIFGFQDSVSLPSEPHDIRNWFSSYKYESPELNISDGFQDFDGSEENCLDEEKEVKYGENQPVGNFYEALFSSANKSSTSAGVIHHELDGLENSNPAAMVTELSQSLSFYSEPPDIKNLFSSYVYESPPLDTTDFCTFSDYKEREDGKLCDAGKSCRQDIKDVINFIDAEESKEFPGQNRISNVVVKCTNMIKNAKLNSQSVCNAVYNVDLKPVTSKPSDLTSVTVSTQLLPGQRTVNNTCGKGKSTCELILTKDCYKDSPQNKALNEIASARILDTTVLKGDCSRSSERRNIGKENEETDLLENGFISVRKKSRANAENIRRPVQVLPGSLSNAAKPLFNPQKSARRSRTVLSDTSNFHSTNVLESTGKWCCPQKNKPNLGPPLKQLRLEQWVRRI